MSIINKYWSGFHFSKLRKIQVGSKCCHYWTFVAWSCAKLTKVSVLYQEWNRPLFLPQFTINLLKDWTWWVSDRCSTADCHFDRLISCAKINLSHHMKFLLFLQTRFQKLNMKNDNYSPNNADSRHHTLFLPQILTSRFSVHVMLKKNKLFANFCPREIFPYSGFAQIRCSDSLITCSHSERVRLCSQHWVATAYRKGSGQGWWFLP